MLYCLYGPTTIVSLWLHCLLVFSSFKRVAFVFPVNSTDRPLRQNDLTILDFLMSDLFKNACVRQTHTDANFLGGSKVFTELLESMREERRNAPKQKGKGKEKQAETSSSSGSSSSSTDSPEMSKKDMQRLLMKMMSKFPTTPEPDDDKDSESQMVTRSSSGKKQKQKRQKMQ